MPEFKPQPVPKSWYKYDWPLTANRPQPSRANYSPENVAPLIRSFGFILGLEPAEIALRYEANSSNVPVSQRDDDIIVGYAGDGVGKPCHTNKPFNSELPGTNPLKRYNKAAKKSKILKKFQDNSPANIRYFQSYDPCNAF